MKPRYFIMLATFFVFSAQCHALPKSTITEGMNQCLTRFQGHIQGNSAELNADYQRSLEQEKALKLQLEHQFFVVSWIEKAYDSMVGSTWDLEHPSRMKTTVGKLRATRSRVKFLREKLYLLSELQRMHPVISERVNPC